MGFVKALQISLRIIGSYRVITASNDKTYELHVRDYVLGSDMTFFESCPETAF